MTRILSSCRLMPALSFIGLLVFFLAVTEYGSKPGANSMSVYNGYGFDDFAKRNTWWSKKSVNEAMDPAQCYIKVCARKLLLCDDDPTLDLAECKRENRKCFESCFTAK